METSATTKRALSVLIEQAWIQTIRLGRIEAALAYVVNSRIAWADSAAKISASHASMRVCLFRPKISDLGSGKLLKAPVMAPGDLQLPVGDGLAPPVRNISGMLLDLPSISRRLRSLKTTKPAARQCCGFLGFCEGAKTVPRFYPGPRNFPPLVPWL